MNAFFLLVVAGLAWLGLLNLSGLLGFPPQLVSLARSGYIGTFSIFMMLELRREATGVCASPVRVGLKTEDVLWYLVPLMSLVVLTIFSHDLILTPEIVVTVEIFYICQLCIFFLREKLGKIRSAVWDLAPPLLLAGMLTSHVILYVSAFVGIVGIILLLNHGRTIDSSSGVADSLIMQLPSLCLAPVILIVIRDYFDFGGMFSRAHVETIGMIVNGVGAALWTALVMRYSKYLVRWAIFLWMIGCMLVVVSQFVFNAILSSIFAILVVEIFRGALWLGTTHLMSARTRWAGFSINMLATSLPFLALWLAKSNFDLHYLLLVYTLFHLIIPLTLIAEPSLRKKFHSCWK